MRMAGFCAHRSSRDPAGKFHHLKSFYWNVRWQARFLPHDFASPLGAWFVTPIAEGQGSARSHVLVFDEFADLILIGRNEKREFEEMVARLAGKGRAAGIHLVLATQRPDRTVVTGLVKSNLPMKVCLRVANATNSQIVLGEPGAERLLGKGDLLCDLGRGSVRAQSYFIPQADFVRALGGHPHPRGLPSDKAH
jgi:hypothetical protein